MKTEIKPSWIRRCVTLLLLAMVSLVLVANIVILNSTKGKIYDIGNISSSDINGFDTAIVLGASVSKNKLNRAYELRVSTALELYRQSKVQKILISGDGGGKYYDEITPAVNYLKERGVPDQDIMSDTLGLDTYDSIQRALQIYKLQNVVIVSQAYHLPRAIYIANALNMQSVGVKASDAGSSGQVIGGVREWYARVKAFIEVWVSV